MAKACIAVDIGASGGKIVAGFLQDDKMTLEEVHRFKNSIVHIGEHDCWDIDAIFEQIKIGLGKLKAMDIEPESIGIDTWAIDYILLDRFDKRIYPVFSYRDHRTDGIMEEFLSRNDRWEIYQKTGIQFLQFNTAYQLTAHLKEYGEAAERACCFLMVPDYLNYLLCGKKTVEFTNATTTQLFSQKKREWDKELIEATGFKTGIFPPIVEAGTVLGKVSHPEIIKLLICGSKDESHENRGLCSGTESKSGSGPDSGADSMPDSRAENMPDSCHGSELDIKVIVPATHDTGSAVLAVPSIAEDFAYISSGTWSLMGIETKEPICTKKAMEYNFTNEGGAFGTYRVLKNIMGMWLIQEVQRNYDYKYSFDDMVDMAQASEPFKCLIDPDSSRFLNPANMVDEIRSFCYETAQPVPLKPGETARCIFESLGFRYREVMQELTEICPKQINRIHVIGGGTRNGFLNQLCANFTGREVYAGPVEATAAGNLAAQFITLSRIGSVEEARRMISKSLTMMRYLPEPDLRIMENWDRFTGLLSASRQ